MNNVRLLGVMIAKEIRTTFRERSQIGAIAFSLLVMVFVLGTTFYHAKAGAHHPRQGPKIAEVVAKDPRAAAAIQWAATGVAVAAGFFFSMGYLTSAVLASFVGEKEARTLEILLASPLSDRKLYSVKCISALLPSLGIGFSFTSVLAILVGTFGLPDGTELPAGLLAFSLILSLPILALFQLWFVGLGAAISVKAETMKGAGQIFGVVFIVFFFGIGYGGPLLWQEFTVLHIPMMQFIKTWFKMPFVSQYGSVLILFGIPAVLLIGIGRVLFRRDRMLT